MALAAGLHGCVRLSFFRAGKINQFGANFKVRILVDNDVIKPFRKVSGKVVIETRFPIKHRGILVQFEGMCTLRYATKFDNRTTFHQGRECILENTKKEQDGYQESPIRYIILEEPPQPDSSTGAGVNIFINPGTVTFPFSLDIPGNPQLPAPFKSAFGNLVHRLVVYMKSSNDVYVEVGELIMKFNGHHNLLGNAEAMKPTTIEQFYKKSVFNRKRLVETVLSLETSGFLPEESIPFVFYVRNPKLIPLKVSVQLIQQLKYDANGRRDSPKRRFIIVSSKEKECFEPDPEMTWIDCLTTRENQEPTFTAHFMYNVTYSIQYKVKILDHGAIKGEAPIYIGTTRDSMNTLKSYASCLDVTFPGMRRRGSSSSANSVRSHSSATTTLSLPPAYSQLSSRIPSVETLPPTYDEVEFLRDAQDVTLEVPQPTQTGQGISDTPEAEDDEEEEDDDEITVHAP